jgi:hypothetical protein
MSWPATQRESSCWRALLAPHILWSLVVTQTKKSGVPQSALGGPFDEANLCH